MLNLLKNFFENENTEQIKSSNDDLQLICGLMIEAANTDGNIDQNEVTKIKYALTHLFKENKDDVDRSIDIALQNSNNDKSLYYYTSKINKDYPFDKKVLLIEILWEVVLSDGELHDYEASLIRRLSGLLYISDIDSGNAKKRALNKLGL